MKIEFRLKDTYRSLICEDKHCKKPVILDGVYILYLTREEYVMLNLDKTVHKEFTKTRDALNDWPTSVELCKSHFNKLLEKHKDEFVLAMV